ncbi:MAG: DUF1566 domain-containing protein, partial [Epsilonproteobacteria bacterium]|nr:DUF1566 domain-containing protein [Campylobacterota bacterium]
DWRLPTISELTSIIDYNRSYPAIDFIFNNITDKSYWTSTTDKRSKDTNNGAWKIHFAKGKTGTTLKYSDNYRINHIRCVK